MGSTYWPPIMGNGQYIVEPFLKVGREGGKETISIELYGNPFTCIELFSAHQKNECTWLMSLSGIRVHKRCCNGQQFGD